MRIRSKWLDPYLMALHQVEMELKQRIARMPSFTDIPHDEKEARTEEARNVLKLIHDLQRDYKDQPVPEPVFSASDWEFVRKTVSGSVSRRRESRFLHGRPHYGEAEQRRLEMIEEIVRGKPLRVSEIQIVLADLRRKLHTMQVNNAPAENREYVLGLIRRFERCANPEVTF